MKAQKTSLLVASLALVVALLAWLPPAPRALAQGVGGGAWGALNLLDDTFTAFDATSSNGTTAVTLGPSAVANKKVYVGKLFFSNTGSVTHTVTLYTSSGAALGCKLQLTPLATGVVDDAGILQTVYGDALQFKIDAGGSANDVVASGRVVQK